MVHVCWCEADGRPRGSTHQPCPWIMHGGPRRCVNCGREFFYSPNPADGSYPKQTSECKKENNEKNRMA